MTTHKSTNRKILKTSDFLHHLLKLRAAQDGVSIESVTSAALKAYLLKEDAEDAVKQGEPVNER